jgi:hypothetical protein
MKAISGREFVRLVERRGWRLAVAAGCGQPSHLRKTWQRGAVVDSDSCQSPAQDWAVATSGKAAKIPVDDLT